MSLESRARSTLQRAVKAGKVRKPGRCADCHRRKTRQLLHGHHADYTKPLRVRWLCSECHWRAHRTDPIWQAQRRVKIIDRKLRRLQAQRRGYLAFLTRVQR